MLDPLIITFARRRKRLPSIFARMAMDPNDVRKRAYRAAMKAIRVEVSA